MAHLRFDLPRDNLAQKLGGGLPRNALCVVAGEAGAGKSILCQRIAHGALHQGARVAYVSTELGVRRFLEQMRSVGYGVEREVVERRLAFYTTQPRSEAVPRARQLGALLGSRVAHDRDLVVVDRVSSLFRDARAAGAARMDAAVEGLLAWTRGGRTVLVALDPADGADGELGSLERVADVYLELRTEMAGPRSVHLVRARRFARPLSPVTDLLGFRVEPRVGILLEIKAVHG